MSDDFIKLVLAVFACCYFMTFLPSCVKKAELWKDGPSVEFYEGFDVHAGANGIDNVKDTRGVGGSRGK